MATDPGEDRFQSVWCRCRLSASLKPDEAFIRIDEAFAPEPPAFYVKSSLVSPQPLAEEADGRVRVTLLHQNNGRSLVEVSGEPLTFGPRVEVPTELLK